MIKKIYTDSSSGSALFTPWPAADYREKGKNHNSWKQNTQLERLERNKD